MLASPGRLTKTIQQWYPMPRHIDGDTLVKVGADYEISLYEYYYGSPDARIVRVHTNIEGDD
jgi:hypothetical protein